MADPVIDTEAFRLARARRGFLQKELAERAQVNPTYLSEIENGRQPSLIVAFRLATALEVAPETFILAERKAAAS